MDDFRSQDWLLLPSSTELQVSIHTHLPVAVTGCVGSPEHPCQLVDTHRNLWETLEHLKKEYGEFTIKQWEEESHQSAKCHCTTVHIHL